MKPGTPTSAKRARTPASGAERIKASITGIAKGVMDISLTVWDILNMWGR